MAESGSEKVISCEIERLHFTICTFLFKESQAHCPCTIQNQIWNYLIGPELLGLKEEPDHQLHKKSQNCYQLKLQHT